MPGAAPDGRRARVREVIVHLPAHPIDLLRYGCSHLGLTGCPRAFRLVREDGERRLQTVREIARLGDRALDRFLSMLEQRVEIVDERLHLGRVRAFDSPISPFVKPGKTARRLLIGERPRRTCTDTREQREPPQGS